MGKTKLFKIPPRHVLPQEEKYEWLRLNQNYRTQMRSVRSFFMAEVENKRILRAQELTPADEEAEYQRINAINEAWNLQVAQIRDARLEKDNAERREFIQQRMELKKVREVMKFEKIESIVRKEKENAATFITRDNIDQAIEHALANPIDYNFSVDLKGTLYKGNERPCDKKPEKLTVEQVMEP